MILQIKPSNDPLLFKVMEPFDFKTPPCDPVQLANDLIETMKEHRGLGLSANQCGLPYRVFVLWSEKPLVCFNPRIVDETTEPVLLEEGCLSFPHLFVKVKRPKAVKVRFEDAYGQTHTEKFIGMTARGFLHELDHLDGILFHKRASGPHLSRALNQQKMLERRLKRGEVRIRPTELPADTTAITNQELVLKTTDNTVTLS